MKIIKNLSWTFFANLFVGLTKWLVIVLIARFLSPIEVGIYSLAFAITAPITLFANMKLRSLYVTGDNESFSNYIYSRNGITVLTIATLLIIGILIYPEYFMIIMLVGATKVLDLQSDIYYALPHKDNEMDLIGKLMIVKHLTILFSFSITMIISENLILSLFIQILIQILFLYFIEINIINSKYKYVKNYSIKAVKKILLLGLPLGLVQMLVSLNTAIPRYLLEFIESPQVLGYFSAIAYIITIGNTMMNSITQNFLPMLSEKIRNNKFNSFKRLVFIKLSLFSFVLGSALIIGSFLFGEVFLGIVYGKEYADYNHILILMSVALTINFISWNFDTALLSLRYISIQPKIAFFILVINLFLSYFLIKENGIYGAAFSMIIINLIQLFLRTFFVRSKLNEMESTNLNLN